MAFYSPSRFTPTSLCEIERLFSLTEAKYINFATKLSEKTLPKTDVSGRIDVFDGCFDLRFDFFWVFFTFEGAYLAITMT